MPKKHYLITLKDSEDGKRYSFTCGTLNPVENDYNNGAILYFDDSTTDLYTFFSDKDGKTYYVNDLIGIQISVSVSEYINSYYESKAYTSINLSETMPIPTLTISIKNGNNLVRGMQITLVPRLFFSNRAIINSSQVQNNCFGGVFLWDEYKNNLNWASLAWQTSEVGTTESGGKIYLHSAVTGYFLRNDRVFEELSKNPYSWRDIPQSPNKESAWVYDPALWEYIFTHYGELTGNTDYNDTDKQKPISWEYPIGPGGPSEPGGGDGDQDDPSDPIPVDDIIDGLSSDFVKLYKITKANLTALSEYMLQDDFLTNIKKLYADPMDAIISLNTFPINATGTAGTITTSGVSTGISAVQINNSIIDIDCGTVALNEYWGSFLDYETKISLFLPYVGIQSISTDDFMNDIIHVIYRVDLLSGGFVVFVKNSKGIVHQTTGNMAYHMPVTSIDYSRMFSALITGAVGIAGNAATGNAAGAITGTMSTIQNFHPQIQMSGNFGGNTGICSNKKPYLIIERPVPNVPANYSDLKGNTSNVTVTLGNCSGFTQISDMQIKHISATDAEKEQIINLLTSGVYF